MWKNDSMAALSRQVALRDILWNTWCSLKLVYVPIVNVEAVKPNVNRQKNSLLASAQETAKYQVKSKDILTNNQEQDLQVIGDLEQALAGSRQISYGGLLKEIRKQLQLEDVENGDLINTDSDDQKVNQVVREIVAKWDYQRKNYFIWMSAILYIKTGNHLSSEGDSFMIYADKISFNRGDEERLETIVRINLHSDGGEGISGWYPKETINDWLHRNPYTIEVDIAPNPKLVPVDHPVKGTVPCQGNT